MDSGQWTIGRMICFGLLSLIVTATSCKPEMKFDREKWNYQTDPAAPPDYRNRMVNDLMQHHQLIGLHYTQLVQLLGEPSFIDGTIDADYELDIDYGRDIDPIYIKNLTIHLSKDSVVTSFKIDEWRK